jgi:hypothetical protein
MDNSDDILAGLTPEQEKEMLKSFETLGKEMEHSDGVKELKFILEARAEALKILKQIKKDENGKGQTS